jgi:hypothetical protein
LIFLKRHFVYIRLQTYTDFSLHVYIYIYIYLTGEMLLFGGEYCDGEQTTVYNELFRWNIEKVYTYVYVYEY